jgi:glycosyltransferase involved in cell wall biosynthesis
MEISTINGTHSLLKNKILIVHNCYQQPGGEDVVAKQEAEFLRQAGHEVVKYYRSNDEVKALGLWGKFSLAKRVVWAGDVVRDLRALIHREKPDVVHFHNTFLMISPSAYYACQELGLPLVQTLHNYRLICPGALLMRDGKVCEDCLRKIVPWPGVVHGCWRNSRSSTTVVAAMLTFHNVLRTWENQVDVYIATTEFARRKFAQGGLPAEKIVVKPNFVHPDPGNGGRKGDFALFVGRISAEKGIRTMLSAWRLLKGVSLKIVGDGPLMAEVKEQIERERLAVEVLNRRPREEVFSLMRQASFLVSPSECYEVFHMVIAEAFACGLPAVASRLGAMAEIVEDGRTGLLFEPGNSEDLAAKVEWAWTHEKEMIEMGKNARKEYEEKYTAERNYKMLMEIYQLAMERAKQRNGA